MFFHDKSLFFFLTAPPLSEAALRTKSLRKSAERSKYFLCFGFLLDTSTSKNPTAHIIIYVLRLFPARLVHVKPHRY